MSSLYVKTQTVPLGQKLHSYKEWLLPHPDSFKRDQVTQISLIRNFQTNHVTPPHTHTRSMFSLIITLLLIIIIMPTVPHLNTWWDRRTRSGAELLPPKLIWGSDRHKHSCWWSVIYPIRYKTLIQSITFHFGDISAIVWQTGVFKLCFCPVIIKK